MGRVSAFQILTQLDRTRNRSLAHKIMKSSFTSWVLVVAPYAAAIFATFLIAAMLSTRSDSNTPRLAQAQIDSLLNDANQAQTVNEKIEFLFRLQRSQLESQRHHNKSKAAAAILSRPSITAFLTLCIVFGLLGFSWWKHYHVRYSFGEITRNNTTAYSSIANSFWEGWFSAFSSGYSSTYFG